MYNRNTDRLDRDLKSTYNNTIDIQINLSIGEIMYRTEILQKEQDRRNIARAINESYLKKKNEIFLTRS